MFSARQFRSLFLSSVSVQTTFYASLFQKIWYMQIFYSFDYGTAQWNSNRNAKGVKLRDGQQAAASQFR